MVCDNRTSPEFVGEQRNEGARLREHNLQSHIVVRGAEEVVLVEVEAVADRIKIYDQEARLILPTTNLGAWWGWSAGVWLPRR